MGFQNRRRIRPQVDVRTGEEVTIVSDNVGDLPLLYGAATKIRILMERESGLRMQLELKGVEGVFESSLGMPAMNMKEAMIGGLRTVALASGKTKQSRKNSKRVRA